MSHRIISLQFLRVSINPLFVCSRLLFMVYFLISLALVRPSNAQSQSTSELAKPSAPFNFMHLGDPQFGYGLDYKNGTLVRMQGLAKYANLHNVDLVIIPGDLVQDRDLAEWWIFERCLKSFNMPVLLVPGNHDMENLTDLKSYRNRIGKDYYDYVSRQCAFIFINSETLRDTTVSADENKRQWQWLEATLAKHQQQGIQHIIFVTHRPPFLYRLNEPKSGSNWPPESRQRLLKLAKRYNVKTICCGHSHTTKVIPAPEYELTIYTVGGAARVFDNRGTGYRLFTVTDATIEQDYVQTATPPKQSVGFCGLRNWTPRLFDFCVRHWLFTLAYGIVAGLCFWKYRTAKQKFPHSPNGYFWLKISFFLLFLCLNWQLDFDELVAEFSRKLFQVLSLTSYRHYISPFLGGFMLLALLGYWIRQIRKTRPPRKIYFLIVMGLVSPFSWFVLSWMSNKKIGMILPEIWWDRLEILSLLLIATIAMLKLKK